MRIAIKFHRLLCEQSGATAVEYGLLVGLIAATILSAVQIVGGGIAETLEITGNAILGAY